MADLNDLMRDLSKASTGFAKLRKDLPRIAGVKMVETFRRNLDKEGFIENGRLHRWPQRTPGSPRDRGRKLLRDRGKLYDSIRVTRRTDDSVAVGVDEGQVPYARLNNEGGVVIVTDRMRAYFWAMFAKTKLPFWRRMALKKSPQIIIPQRQFMGITPDLDKTVEREIAARLKVIFGAPS